MFGLLRSWRRRNYRKQPMPAEWLAIVEDKLPFYARLPEGLAERFRADLMAFVHEKHFFGAGGLELTDEHRVVTSGVAVRLTLHLDLSVYDRLTEIVIYPYDYAHPDSDAMVFGEAHSWEERASRGTPAVTLPADASRGAKNAEIASPTSRSSSSSSSSAHRVQLRRLTECMLQIALLIMVASDSSFVAGVPARRSPRAGRRCSSPSRLGLS